MDATAILSSINIFVTIIIFIFTVRNNSKIEKLKSQLEIQNDKKKVLFDEEKKALVEYLSSWTRWYESLKIQFPDYTSSNYETMKDIQPIYRKGHSDVLNHLAKLDLFLNNTEIVNSGNQLRQDTFNLQRKNIEYIIKIYLELDTFNAYKTEIGGKIIHHKEKREKITEEIKTNMLKYLDEVNPIHEHITKSQQAFIKLAKEYIRKDIT